MASEIVHDDACQPIFIGGFVAAGGEGWGGCRRVCYIATVDMMQHTDAQLVVTVYSARGLRASV